MAQLDMVMQDDVDANICLMPAEVLCRISDFLCAGDLKAYNCTAKFISVSIRPVFFSRFRVHLQSTQWWNPCFMEIAPSITAISGRTDFIIRFLKAKEISKNVVDVSIDMTEYMLKESDDLAKSIPYLPTSVTTLHISHDLITFLPLQITRMTWLTELYVNHNDLSDRNSLVGIGNLVALTKLDISDNAITELPGELGNLVQLKVLVINHNSIETLPDTIGRLVLLEELYMINIPLEWIPVEVANFKSLRKLYLLTSSGLKLDFEPSTLFLPLITDFYLDKDTVRTDDWDVLYAYFGTKLHDEQAD